MDGRFFERFFRVDYVLIYPDDLRAKIYKLRDSRYDKEGDFLMESYRFEETTCGVELDFEKVFRRYRQGS